jgi:hypothetical protein
MRKKITVIASAIVITATVSLFAIVSPSKANDIYSTPFSNLKQTLKQNKQFEKQNIVLVNDEAISKNQLEDYKSYKKSQKEINNDASITLDDSTLLKELITEKLLLQEAKSKNVEASIEVGKHEAEKMIEFLKTQPQNVQDFQKNVIDVLGISEEQYWNEYAPKQYQDLESLKNLSDKLSAEGILPNGKDFNDFGKKYNEYKKNLYNMEIGKKVKVLDTSFNLN